MISSLKLQGIKNNGVRISRFIKIICYTTETFLWLFNTLVNRMDCYQSTINCILSVARFKIIKLSLRGVRKMAEGVALYKPIYVWDKVIHLPCIL